LNLRIKILNRLKANKEGLPLYVLLGDKKILEDDNFASDLFAEICRMVALNLVQVKRDDDEGREIRLIITEMGENLLNR